MSAIPRYIPNHTLEDYQHWQGAWEMIDGVAIAISPGPFGPHERTVSRLSRMVGNQIDADHCDCEVYTGLDWIISNNTVIRPDLLVVCGPQPQRHLERSPTLMVEILSDATRARDLELKRDLAIENDVMNYLAIDPVAKTILCFNDQGEQAIDTSAQHKIRLETDCEISVLGCKLFDVSNS